MNNEDERIIKPINSIVPKPTVKDFVLAVIGRHKNQQISDDILNFLIDEIRHNNAQFLCFADVKINKANFTKSLYLPKLVDATENDICLIFKIKQ